MAQIFKAKTLIANSGRFAYEVSAPNLISNTGDQTISGIKTFANNLEVQGTGIFNALDLSNISEFNFSGTNINLISGNVNISGGTLYISGNAVLTGVNLNAYATTVNLFATGSTLDNKINSLSGYVNAQDIVFSGQTFNTGSRLDNKINSLSGVSVLKFGDQNIGGNKTFTGITTFSGQQINVIDTALNLSGVGDMTFDSTNINFINSPVFISGTNLRVSGNVYANNLVYNIENQTISGVKTFDVFPIVSGNKLITGVDLSSYATNSDLFATGSILNTKINNLSGVSVMTFGNQTINGNKSFTESSVLTVKTISGFKGIGSDSVNSLNLIASNDNFITGPVFSAGHINLTAGTGTTAGISDYGNINLNAGGSMFDGKINLKGNIHVNNTTAPSSRTINIYKIGTVSPVLAGLTIDNNNISLNTPAGGEPGFGLIISGVPVTPALYATTTNLASTGSNLDTKINSLSGASVLLYGNQTISGIKTFVENTVFGDPSQGDFLVISGNTFTIYGSGNFINGLFVSGVPVLTGVDLSSYATITNLANTGSNLDTKINNLSGYVTGTNSTFTKNLDTTGSNLYTIINNLSGYVNSSSSNIVFTTGDQIISGNKTFKNNVIIEQTGFFSAIDLSDTDSILLSGVDIQIVSGSITLTNMPTISGNPLITGNLSLYATTINLATTGSTLDTRINNLSGYINSSSSNIVFTTGNQTINGIKLFSGINTSVDFTSGASLTVSGVPVTPSVNYYQRLASNIVSSTATTVTVFTFPLLANKIYEVDQYFKFTTYLANSASSISSSPVNSILADGYRYGFSNTSIFAAQNATVVGGVNGLNTFLMGNITGVANHIRKGVLRPNQDCSIVFEMSNIAGNQTTLENGSYVIVKRIT